MKDSTTKKVKELLKEAKQELARSDYEDAIELSLEVLKYDSKNYFAHVFLGKAYSSTSEFRDLDKAIIHYRKAIDLEPDNLLAWKGLFTLFKSDSQSILPSIVPFGEYFKLATAYMHVLVQQEVSQVELIAMVRALRKANSSVREFLITFYETFRPGTDSYETLGRHLVSPRESLQNLIKLIRDKEADQISKVVSRERLKLSSADPHYQIKINALAWDIYRDSKLDGYYNQLVNILDDDEERKLYESEWLDYRIRVLKSMPVELKYKFFMEVKQMVEGMILVDHDSLFAWKYYFDWMDFEDLNNMDPKVILRFFKKYPQEPLAIILYAWINSKLSTYDVKSLESEMNDSDDHRGSSPHMNIISEEKGKEGTNSTETPEEEVEEEAQELLEAEEEGGSTGLTEEDVLISLIENVSKAKDSTLAYRIISYYYITNREYQGALSYIKQGITLTAYALRDLGANLTNTKKELTIDIATCYTYVEAPRNHQAALSLFDKILSEDPNNTKSQIGKSIISIERNDWSGAYTLLKKVSARVPSNLEVLSQLAWCQGHLGELDESIETFITVLNRIEGTDMRTMNFRATNLWRQAKVYLMKRDSIEDPENKYVQSAFKLLIQIIKVCSDTFAKSYSTLGDIYSQYYDDQARAFKCYYKAFELDSSDIVAAKYVTEVFCNAGNWSAAAQIAERLIKEEKASNDLRRVNWPFRVVGISYIEKQMDSESIEWFQSSLRIAPSDVESWVGLGQAYLGCGRVEASIKVFEKALELDDKHYYAKYFYAKALSEIGEFEQSIDILRELTALCPEEEAFQVLLAEHLVGYAHDLYLQGFLKKSISTSIEAISVVKLVVNELHCSAQNVWIALSKALGLFICVSSEANSLPVESLVEIFQCFDLNETEEVDKLDGVKLEMIAADTGSDNIAIVCRFMVLSSKCALASADFETLTSTVRASLWYNIAVAELSSYLTLGEDKFRDASILAFKKSIKCQSNTTESWLGLGIATMDLNYRVAQHCFIKALNYSPRDVSIWFALALLALKNNDIEFASEVVSRTQSLEPQNSSPWLALALIRERMGDKRESKNLFAHSFILSKGRSKASQLWYARSVLENRIGSGDDERDIGAVEEFSAIIFGLQQYFKKRPEDPYALEYALLSLERLHNFEKAGRICKILISILERQFEKIQSNVVLNQFAVVKAQEARIHLAMGGYEAAIDASNLSDGILSDSTLGEKFLPAKVSNHICLGLANFFLGNFDETLDQFQQLLEMLKSSRTIIILVSKVLYDVGMEDTKSTALQELTEYITSTGFDLMVTLTLAAMTILEGNLEDVRIVLGELRSIPLSGLVADKHKDVVYLVKETIKRIQKNSPPPSEDMRRITLSRFSQRSAFFFPNDHKVWANLDKKIERRLLLIGQNKVSAEQLSMAYMSNKSLICLQRSLYLCPWNKAAVMAMERCFL